MSEEFRKETPPPPVPVDASRHWAQAAGMRAALEGLPPSPPREFAIYSRDWRIGWENAMNAPETGWRGIFKEVRDV